MRSLQRMTRSKQVKDLGKKRASRRSPFGVSSPARARARPLSRSKKDICSVSQTRRSFFVRSPSPLLCPDPLICRLSTRGKFAMTDEAQKIHTLPFVNSAVQFLVRRGLLNDFEIGENIGGHVHCGTAPPLSSRLFSLNYENGIVTFHSQSNSQSAERGRETESEGDRPQESTEKQLSTAYYSFLLGLRAAPPPLQSHRISGHIFHAALLSSRIYCPRTRRECECEWRRIERG